MNIQREDEAKHEDFVFHEELGRGGFSIVQRAVRKADNEVVAIKTVKLFDMPTPRQREESKREAHLLQLCQHPNIVKYFGSFEHKNDLCIVMELAQGDLRMFINEHRQREQLISESDIWIQIFGVASALTYMHEQRVMHRDIKPENVYLTDKGGIKLGDLGLGRVLSDYTQNMSVVGTPVYMSPELVQERPYGFESDIWSLGCLLYELAAQRHPFMPQRSDATLLDLANNISRGVYEPLPDCYSDTLRRLVNAMLQLDVKRRPTASEVVQFTKAVVNAAMDTRSQHVVVPNQQQPQAVSAVPVIAEGNAESIFEDLGKIGEGSCATVHRARHRLTNQLFAIKVVRIFNLDAAAREQCMNEASLLKSLPRHRSIIEYYDFAVKDNELYLVLELAEQGDLNKLIDQNRAAKKYIDEKQIWYYFVQICSAVNIMHSCRMMHRDIKPGNIFLKDNHECKLGDLGHGTAFTESKTIQAFSAVGTPFYTSPEAFSSSGYGLKSDIWSLGCVLYELAALQSPFWSERPNLYQLSTQIQNGTFPPLPDHFSDGLKTLVAQMLHLDPDKRPTAQWAWKRGVEALQFYKLTPP